MKRLSFETLCGVLDTLWVLIFFGAVLLYEAGGVTRVVITVGRVAFIGLICAVVSWRGMVHARNMGRENTKWMRQIGEAFAVGLLVVPLSLLMILIIPNFVRPDFATTMEGVRALGSNWGLVRNSFFLGGACAFVALGSWIINRIAFKLKAS